MDQEQKRIVAEYLSDKHCISAWKANRSALIISELNDHERLFNLLFDNGFKVEPLALSDWHYYAEAQLGQITCHIVDDDEFERRFKSMIEDWSNPNV
nr:hypothetical protein [uncultured Arsenicibacter sp.]